MAIWTFTASLLPAEALGEKAAFTEDELDEAEPKLWLAREDAEKIIGDLSALLPKTKSWNEDLAQWGADQSDRIQVWRVGGQLDSVQIKIDCRAPRFELIDAIEQIAHSHSLALVYQRTLQICRPADGAFRRFILSSANCRALADPKQWIPHMASEIRQQENDET